MLRSIKDIMGYPIEANDGSIGKVKDCLFDDRHWRLRYLVADTAKWLPGKKVLISPFHLKQPGTGWFGKKFPVDLTKSEIEKSPALGEDAPVSRNFEEEYARYYDHSLYWAGPYAWGATPAPMYGAVQGAIPTRREINEHDANLKTIEKSHLRSSHETIGYSIRSRDEEFGHVEDFIMEDEFWHYQYLVIDSRNWLPGKKFLIDINWIEDFDWQEQTASVELTKKQIESSPEFDPHEPINRDYLNNLYDYYGQPFPYDEPGAPVL